MVRTASRATNWCCTSENQNYYELVNQFVKDNVETTDADPKLNNSNPEPAPKILLIGTRIMSHDATQS